MASLALSGIEKSFGDTAVLKGIDLAIEDGEFLTLVGPSGCGKSTLIRIIAGLEAQDQGTVAIGGEPVDQLRPHERRVAMVFQSYALYPHMTVRENIGLPLVLSRLRLWERIPLLRLLSARRRGVMREVEREVEAIARQLHLETLLGRRPAQLSGGQRQRVALGRAMVRQPRAFLMDEPLSNLDAKLRVHMRSELAELHSRLGATFVYVTHDQVEAMTMSDRIAMMDSGRILQLGTPSELYERPANIKVASFIGSPAINLLPGRVVEGGAAHLFGNHLRLKVDLPPGSPLTVGVRPEAISIAGPDKSAEVPGAVPATLLRRENLGPEFILHFEIAETKSSVVARVPAGPDLPQVADATTLLISPAACHLFNSEGIRIEPISSPDRERLPPSALERLSA
ncbi:ABC transporter ATP-binding protein [Micromonospora sp. STR1s_5]|nr:ABC transporter ATP-binding protein [Micromonospora sp. STR1s_5]